jgi:hypothetical protein
MILGNLKMYPTQAKKRLEWATNHFNLSTSHFILSGGPWAHLPLDDNRGWRWSGTEKGRTRQRGSLFEFDVCSFANL